MDNYYEINENLKKTVLENIPENYTNLEKAILIYKRLCEKLQYSFDYYLDEENVNQYFYDPENIKKIDGEKNKDVVCFTFNAILTHLYIDAGIVSDINTPYNPILKRFMFFHQPVEAVIDGTEYVIDSTKGVLDNNDLVLSKYSGHIPNGWGFTHNSDYHNGKLEELQNTLQKVYSENNSLYSSVQQYVNQKKMENNYLELPMDARIKMFLDLSMNVEYSILGFNNLLKYKHICFNESEFGTTKGGYTIDQQVDLLFAKERGTKEYKAFLFYNPDGYTNDVGYENFDKLQVIEISVKDKTMKQLSYEETHELFKKQNFVTIFNREINPKMTTTGKMDIKYEYSGDRPLYDHHQNILNATRKTRHHVKTGQIEELPLEQ